MPSTKTQSVYSNYVQILCDIVAYPFPWIVQGDNACPPRSYFHSLFPLPFRFPFYLFLSMSTYGGLNNVWPDFCTLHQRPQINELTVTQLLGLRRMPRFHYKRIRICCEFVQWTLWR